MASSNASFEMLSEQNGNEINDEALNGLSTANHEELTNDQANLKHQKLLSEHNALLAKVAKMEQEKQQLFLTCPQNHWNCDDCHSDLFVIQPDCLTIFNHGMSSPLSISVRAQFVMPRHHSGIFFFELKIEKMPVWCHFGLAPKSEPLQGIGEGFFYRSDGTFWGHKVKGCQFHDKGWPYIVKTDRCSFGAGDVVGCGLNLATRQIIYTKNGIRLDTAGLLVHLHDLYPIVSLWGAGAQIKANFGPNFKYDLSKEYSVFDGVKQ